MPAAAPRGRSGARRSGASQFLKLQNFVRNAASRQHPPAPADAPAAAPPADAAALAEGAAAGARWRAALADGDGGAAAAVRRGALTAVNRGCTVASVSADELEVRIMRS